MVSIKNRQKAKRLPRNLEGYLDTVPTKCERCRANGHLPLTFHVTILCKACLLLVLAELGIVAKINSGKPLACPQCYHPLTFPRQVIYTNGRIRHSGRCATHGCQEWWLNDGN